MSRATYDLSGQDCIVVGGAGYIGSHVCKEIQRHGGRPITFDNLSSGHEHAVKWGPLVKVDVSDEDSLNSAFSKFPNAKTVIHLASSIEVGFGEKYPAEFYDNNVVGALILLKAMRKAGADRLIFSSTCATYGETQNMPLTEDELQNPFSTYGKTKLAIEHMIQSFHKAYGLQYVTLRYFNASGADADGDIGEEHDPETHLIPNAMKAAAGKAPHMTLLGMDYDTPDGTPIRDYIHVTDIALAHLDAISAFTKGLSHAEVNIGTGKGASVLDILNAIERVTGKPVPYHTGPRRDGDLTQLYADASKAKAVLGFTPQHSELENIIATAWAFHQKKWS